jgi:serine/threonine protein kinase
LFSQIVEAFKILFKENILHRDLKPTNVLFHDFGFCKELLNEGNMAETMIGSPIYMAPEVLKGQAYNSKADIWSMGVMLHEMLFGKCPFEETSMNKLISLIDSSTLKLPLEKNPISENTQNLLRRMLTVDVQKRMSPTELLNYKFVDGQSE